MNLLKAIVVGSVIFGSALSYAGDGYDRSMKFNEKFRADQKRIHGSESAGKKLDVLEAKNTRPDQSNMLIKKETKTD
ncbi:MAG: hypothetical protein CVV19_06500 [Gammaproteobacteria bacterium HGW-Gammaproteobacteria-9]|uniref:Secreted protein n=2 Tax=Stutzerimonas TaxID=2901164 RepID=A0ABX4VUR9_9GAMM|nr:MULTISPECIES: hypothetical protein [Pseudomonadaceae]PKL99689.1 MAG: hypothetical protein CVV19_06500 [Gammaproteobacteria bacterium HGW-Gammaproteobacteria-9]MBA1264570.1 hypothetical protein [Stutzerimonas stutzeri]MCF6782021.1 hypothetical protein [Stutzerimonas stutzeri]MCF6803729.1 hypothetical protein [Stutzerimonas stutzeri]MCQ4246626.1 hypothetical protein [Stutzerimonas decontaminans]